MYTKTLLTRGVLFAGLVVILSGYGLPADQWVCRAASEFSHTETASPPSRAMTAEEPTLKRASRVMHARVKSPQGETLGTVHDIVLTSDLSEVSYVALSTGGILGLGARLHAVPWSALSVGLNDTYIAPMTKQQLKQSRGFAMGYWPESPEGGWAIQTTDTGERPTYRSQTISESRNVQERRFTRIRGTSVRDADGDRVGTVRDLIIAMDDGRVNYTVVSTGGLLGLGTRYAAVPRNNITFEMPRHVARLDVDESVVVANAFPPGRFPDLANPAYAQRLNLAFAPVTGTTALGYVPAAPAAPAQRPATRPAPPSAGGTTRAMPPAATLTEPTEAELTGTFNPASVKTLDGTVIDEGKFRVAGTGPDMLWLRIRTEDGQTVTANLGPRSYIASQDFYIVRGDRIRLTGSDVTTTIAGKHVFLPTEITYNNQVLRLRSASGAPLWQGRAGSATPDTTRPTTTTPSTESAMPSTPTPGSTTTPGTTSRATDTAREPNEPDELDMP